MANGREIKQRISLEGGEAIIEALKALGAAGEKAFEQIRKAAEGTTAAKPLERLAKTAEILKERLIALGAAGRRVADAGRAFGTAWGKLSGNVQKLTRNVALLTGALTAAAAGFIAFIKAGADAADEANHQAKALGLAIDEYGRLKFAAEQAGVSQETFGTAITRLNVALGKLQGDLSEAAEETSAFERLGAQSGVIVRRFGEDAEKSGKQTLTAASALTELGIKATDANGALRPTEDILFDLADAFTAMQDGPREAALQVALFGRAAGPELAQLLNEGSAAMRASGKRAEVLGAIHTAEAAAIGDAFGDAFNEVAVALLGIRNRIAQAFLPGLTEVATALADFVAQSRPALEAFARDLASKIVPVIKDLFNALTGNDTKVVNQDILKWRDAVLEFGRGVQEVVTNIVIPAFNTLLGIFDAIAAGLNSVFGTEFTGGALLAAAAVAQFLGVFAVLGSAVGVVVSGVNLLVAAFGLVGPALLAASGFISLLVEGVITFGAAIAAVVGWPALIVAGIVAALVAIVIFWDEIVAAAQATWDFIAGLFTAAGFAKLWDGLASGAQAAWDATIGVVQAGVNAVGNILGTISTLAGGAFAGVLTAAQFVVDGLAGIFNAAAQTIAAIWQGISDTVAGIFGGTSSAILDAAQAITDALSAASEAAADTAGAEEIAQGLVQPFRDAAALIEEIWNGVTVVTQSGFDGILDGADAAVSGLGNVAQEITARLRRELDAMTAALNTALSRILAAIDRAVSRLRAAAREARSSGGDSGEGFARGGLVYGPGTGTSDSIPAYLSRGEFVVNARAVRKLGLGVMRMINAGRVAGEKIKGSIPRFAQGGLADGFSLPDFGGLIRSLAEGLAIPAPQLALAGVPEISREPRGNSIYFQLPGGGETVGPFFAEEQVFGKLSSFAGKAGMRQMGRSPGWR